jgi:hypothetical protein
MNEKMRFWLLLGLLIISLLLLAVANRLLNGSGLLH